ncbi:MAG: pyrDII [Naasia sp.]|jgi:dihydroorotate dehydrogenase electron transfer subunit|uniref:iron-sulfur cluster-binding protein n=1 Tax=Naasia sp. TaxID=2546198 RepID=UPI00261B8D3A|nr:dihydroorotate oxidase electron transfer subunit [Naasia sp.]MCU1570162.1 pyrDII [Naasia sp.]
MALVLEAPEVAASVRPGQFVMLTAARAGESAPALPRPMAIYSRDQGAGTVEILYGVVGAGTERLRSFNPGEQIYTVGPLGRGFEVAPDVQTVLLVGRGIGTCSLTTVAQENAERGRDTIAVTSARNSGALIGVDFYRKHGAATVHAVTDDDGTSAPAALIASLTEQHDEKPPQLILTCGSDRLTRLCQTLSERWEAPMQVSVEAHMACGLGYCHGCASGARSQGNESPLICADGPAFAWRILAETDA